MSSQTKSLLIIGVAVGAALASVGAQAGAQGEGSTYVELGYTQLNWSEGSLSIKPSNALVRVGYQFNSYLAAELLGAASVSSDTLQGVSFKVDSAYGAYLKGQVPVGPKFELFARAGWLHATFTGSFMSTSVSVGDSSISYGVGAQYHFTKNWYVQGDYASYFNKGGDSIKGPSVSVGYRF